MAIKNNLPCTQVCAIIWRIYACRFDNNCDRANFFVSYCNEILLDREYLERKAKKRDSSTVTMKAAKSSNFVSLKLVNDFVQFDMILNRFDKNRRSNNTLKGNAQNQFAISGCTNERSLT